MNNTPLVEQITDSIEYKVFIKALEELRAIKANTTED